MKATLFTAFLTLTLGIAHVTGSDPKPGGPNGGRLLTKVEPQIEFVVKPDRTVELNFLDAEKKPVAPAGQVIKVVAGERSDPIKLEFKEKDGKLISDGKLPEGNGYPVVVQIKETPEAKVVNEKFNLNMEKCPTCDFAEYACICGHE